MQRKDKAGRKSPQVRVCFPPPLLPQAFGVNLRESKNSVSPPDSPGIRSHPFIHNLRTQTHEQRRLKNGDFSFGSTNSQRAFGRDTRQPVRTGGFNRFTGGQLRKKSLAFRARLSGICNRQRRKENGSRKRQKQRETRLLVTTSLPESLICV